MVFGAVVSLTVVCCGVSMISVVSVMSDSIVGWSDCVCVAVDNADADPLICVDVVRVRVTGATDSLFGDNVLMGMDDVALCDDALVTEVSGVVASTAGVVVDSVVCSVCSVCSVSVLVNLVIEVVGCVGCSAVGSAILAVDDVPRAKLADVAEYIVVNTTVCGGVVLDIAGTDSVICC